MTCILFEFEFEFEFELKFKFELECELEFEALESLAKRFFLCLDRVSLDRNSS